MSEMKNWEEETIELIQEAQQEKRKAEQRLLTAQRAIESTEQKIQALQMVLELYRSKYGLPTLNVIHNPELADEYSGIGPKEMLLRWAATHRGSVVMKDVCKSLVFAGLFTSERQAAGTLYSTIRRMKEFRKAARGVYAWSSSREVAPGDFGTQARPASSSDLSELSRRSA